MTSQRVIMAADHGGVELKAVLAAHLRDRGYDVEDLGTDGSTSVDYPDYAHRLCTAFAQGEYAFGILVCGTGQGMAMSANRHPHIRAALCQDGYTAKMARLHNDANVLCLGGRVVGPGLACDIVDVFASTSFEGGRHQRRVAKMTAP